MRRYTTDAARPSPLRTACSLPQRTSRSRVSRDARSRPGLCSAWLDAGSKDNVVEQSIVPDDGWEDVISGPASITIGDTTIHYLSTGREGIAVHGSRKSVIRDNLVTDDAAGGIFASSSCGEDASTPGHWVRSSGASGHVIRHSVARDGPNGIRVGSRSAETQVPTDCSDTPIGDQAALEA